jgi:hypothetical protein
MNNQTCAATAVPGRVTPVAPSGNNVEPAILTEQLTYLSEHAEQCVALECPDCARLSTITELLIEPFQSTMYSGGLPS